MTAGGVAGATQSVTSLVEQRYGEFDELSAYAASFVLAAISILCLVGVTIAKQRTERRHANVSDRPERVCAQVSASCRRAIAS